MSTIRNKMTERGHVHESAWPPDPEVGQSKGFFGYWEQADADTNSITMEAIPRFDRTAIEAEQKKKKSEERKASYQKAIYALRDGNTPLANPDIRAKRQREQEATLSKAGLSLDNVDLKKVTRHGG